MESVVTSISRSSPSFFKIFRTPTPLLVVVQWPLWPPSNYSLVAFLFALSRISGGNSPRKYCERPIFFFSVPFLANFGPRRGGEKQSRFVNRGWLEQALSANTATPPENWLKTQITTGHNVVQQQIVIMTAYVHLQNRSRVRR